MANSKVMNEIHLSLTIELFTSCRRLNPMKSDESVNIDIINFINTLMNKYVLAEYLLPKNHLNIGFHMNFH